MLLGFLDCRDGNLESAEQRFQGIILTGRRLNLPHVEAIGAIGLGSVALERGDVSKARELQELGLAIYVRHQDYWMIGLTLWGIVLVAITQKDYARARSALAEWTGITRELGNRWVLPYILDCHANLALDTDQPKRAARCFGAAEAMHEHFGEQFSPSEQAKQDAALARLQKMLSPQELRQEWEAGRNASPWDVIGEV